jgi:sphinganine-1-phosphate aldolase
MFRINLVVVDYDKTTFGIDLKKLRRAINKNTVAIVGSFPNFPHGTIDNIEEMSKIAEEYKIGLHVDACLGGLLAGFYSHLNCNVSIPKFDFLLPGVTTMSADLHKYGLAPKGVSWLLYKNREYRKNQYFIYPRWMGGTYPSPTIAGSRSPALMICAYAIMLKLGKNFYAMQAKNIHNMLETIKDFAKKNFTKIHVIGDPKICVIAFTGEKISLIYDRMSTKKWHLNLINNPIGFSIAVNTANLKMVEENFCSDLKESYDYVNKTYINII